MSQTTALTIANAAGLYLTLGLLVAVPFVIWGVKRIDPAAQQGTWGFRLLIFPGVVALWPLIVKRWVGATGEPPEEKNAHRSAARARRER